MKTKQEYLEIMSKDLDVSFLEDAPEKFVSKFYVERTVMEVIFFTKLDIGMWKFITPHTMIISLAYCWISSQT